MQWSKELNNHNDGDHVNNSSYCTTWSTECGGNADGDENTNHGSGQGGRDNIFDEQWGQADDLERKPINFSWIDHRGRSFEELRKEHERFTNVNKSVVQHTSHTQRRQRGNACDHWWPLYDCFVSGYAPSSCQKRFHYALSIAILGSDLSDTALCFLMI